MKQAIKRFFIVGAATTIMMAPAIASADDNITTSDDSTTTSSESEPTSSPTSEPQSRAERQYREKIDARLEQLRQNRKAKSTESESDLHSKLDTAKKKICENRASKIDELMSTMKTRRQNVYDRINKIVTAVENFYVSKGLSVSSYSDLVAAVNAAQSATQTAMAAEQAVPNLDCSGDHPRADVASFKEKRQESIDAMKAYRDAVKDLIKAVKSAAEAANPTPTATPQEGSSNAQ
ncbi:MAG: hypothetical protein H6797_03760 [Candidatus Nomurabacteria bacterium]|nr:MAG: hypothetical protein H6797_03760 [Candidatus Nomurabacteria bacterium]